ncbi:MAG: beta-N-acetylhexosaminidase [Pseudomonadota bacterium]
MVKADHRPQTGRFFILGFDGIRVPASLKKLHDCCGLGGVVLFDRNIRSAQQLKELTRELRDLSPRHPFIISIDQEGGRFQRLKPPHFSAFPPACDVDAETALEIGQRMGEELKDLGINVDFAPVLDVDTNPRNPIIGVRSFGSDPQLVAQRGRLFIKGLEEKGVLACGKHFPGHGDTDEDSHLTLPVVRKDQKALERCELLPFKNLVQQKNHALKCLMTAHVLYPALDPGHPATFSKRILTDLLRGEWGYEGLVISDDMGMAGALSRADLPDASVLSFAAGCDLVLVCEHHDRHEEIITTLRKAIEKSPSLQKRAEESLGRINRVFRGA